LKLELSEEKTKITHLTSKRAKYLGYDIVVRTSAQNLTTRRVSKTKNLINMRKACYARKPKLMINKQDIKNKLISKNLANALGKPRYVGKFI
jgi:hypothetical protein